ncbi:phospholipase D delta [Tanacetum coccineum]
MLWHQNSGAKPLPLNSGAMTFLVSNSILLTWHHFWSLAPKVWHHDSLCSYGIDKLEAATNDYIQNSYAHNRAHPSSRSRARTDILMSEIKLDGGKVFRHASCWEDICYAISEAHHMIYIVGWSIFHKIKLIREPTRSLPRGGDLTLGDLLKYKSEEDNLAKDSWMVGDVDVGGVEQFNESTIVMDVTPPKSGSNGMTTQYTLHKDSPEIVKYLHSRARYGHEHTLVLQELLGLRPPTYYLRIDLLTLP